MANPALIDELEKQFRDNPRRVFARLANEYRKSGDFLRAIEICQAHVPQQPGYISGHIVLGQALYDAGEFDQARQTFETALLLDPENLIALRQLGDIARQGNDLGAARGWYTRLLEVDPHNDEVVAQLGELSPAGAATETGAMDGAAGTEVVAVVADDAPREAWDAGGSARELPGVESDEVAEDVAADTSGIDAPAIDAWGNDPVAAEDDTPGEVEPVEFEATAFEEQPLHLTAERIDSVESAEPDDSVEPLALEESVPGAAEAQDRDPAEAFDDDVSWTGEAGFGLALPDETEREDDAVIDPLAGVTPRGGGDDLDVVVEEAATFEIGGGGFAPEDLGLEADEDPLAGVTPIRPADPSPFGGPIESGYFGEDEEPATVIEPVETSDLDASTPKAEVSEFVPLEAEGLDDEMTRWSEELPAHEGAPDEGAGDALALSDAETLVEDDVSFGMFGWSPTPASTPATSGDAIDAAFEAEWPAPAAASAPDEPAEAARDAADESARVAEPDEDTWSEAGSPFDESLEAGSSWNEPLKTGEFDAIVPMPAPAPDHGDADSYASFESEAAGDIAEAEAGPAEDSAAGADAEPDDAAPPAFVTETMAELYLRQGFRNEALDVYRQLAAQAPGDERLAARIAEIEGGPVVGVGAAAFDEARTAGAFFRALASVRVAVAEPVAASTAPSEVAAWESDALSNAGEVNAEDESAAAALASGYGDVEPEARGEPARPANRRMSLDDIFGGEPERRADPGASMEAFFTPEGERAAEATPPSGGESQDDIEAFNAWLEGLKK